MSKWRPEGWKNAHNACVLERVNVNARIDLALEDTYEQGADAMYEMAVKPLQAQRDNLQNLLAEAFGELEYYAGAMGKTQEDVPVMQKLRQVLEGTS